MMSAGGRLCTLQEYPHFWVPTIKVRPPDGIYEDGRTPGFFLGKKEFLSNEKLRRKRGEKKNLHSTAVHLKTERQDVAADALGKRRLLLGRPVLEKLLNHVVAENVRHQVVGMRQDLGEYHVLLGRRGPLEPLLDVPRPVLVLGELHHVRLQRLWYGREKNDTKQSIDYIVKWS